MNRLLSFLFFTLTCLNSSSLLATDNRLPGTELLTVEGDIPSQMVEGIHKYLIESAQRFRKIIGAVDPRVQSKGLEILGPAVGSASTDSGKGYHVFKVRWPVFEGVTGEGLLLQPENKPFARVVAIPDADWAPEMLAGLAPGVPPAAQFARKLAEFGCQVVIPTLIDRKDTWSGIPGVRMTNQPHREFIYRMSYEVGRHIIGYEVQKILAVLDWFDKEDDKSPAVLTAVMG
jgi:hypothetical protein